ncbi:MAG: hypothetical protein ACP5RC_00475 [Halothiobacillaceae bacterium]
MLETLLRALKRLETQGKRPTWIIANMPTQEPTRSSNPTLENDSTHLHALANNTTLAGIRRRPHAAGFPYFLAKALEPGLDLQADAVAAG